MSSVNKVILIGHLGRDPEMRFTKSGDGVCNFSIATSEKWKDKSGEKKEQTTWHRIVIWGKLAEIASEYLSKGKQVYIEGRLQTREWEDKEGVKHHTTEIVASNMTMLGQAGSGSQSSSGGSQSSAGSQSSSGGQDDFEDDDIPFS